MERVREEAWRHIEINKTTPGRQKPPREKAPTAASQRHNDKYSRGNNKPLVPKGAKGQGKAALRSQSSNAPLVAPPQMVPPATPVAPPQMAPPPLRLVPPSMPLCAPPLPSPWAVFNAQYMYLLIKPMLHQQRQGRTNTRHSRHSGQQQPILRLIVKDLRDLQVAPRR